MDGMVDPRPARRGWRVSWLIAALALLAAAVPALAEPRIALVVGNGRYQTVAELKNPVSDAGLIAGVLRAAGFKVTLLTDSDQAGMKRAIADFGRALRAAGPDTTGLFYYAGHGVQAQGLNYLLPVDSAVEDAADLDLVGVQADWVLRQLFSARNRTNIIILDACRNNPFASFGTDAAPGLAEMIAPTGTFIAYSSAPGSVAVDGAGSNSPFSLALAEAMATPGQAIEQIFKQVRVAVLGATQGYQTTWDSSSLTGDFYFAPVAPADPREVAAEQLWNSLKGAADPVQIIMFLRTYPDSKVSGEARALLEQALAKELAPTAAAPAAPVAAAPVPAGPAAPAVAPAAPSEREVELIERAQASGALADFEAYAAEFPDGVFKDLVTAEIAARQAVVAAPPPLRLPKVRRRRRPSPRRPRWRPPARRSRSSRR